ncbi:hypothetical protein BU17DRAFT_40875 [Hysterangium stoloniferum]|nr:hypothetical protein BU17DRAFT_40875 [Hysterangium stoloniferum]
MSIFQWFRQQHPPTGPGLVVSSRFRELSEKPGYLSLENGSQELRDLYVDGSAAYEPSLLSDFGLACFLGLYDEVKKARLRFFMVESGTAPDICGHETPHLQGYLIIVVLGKRMVFGATLPQEHGKVAQFLITHGAPVDAVDITWHTALQHATILGLIQPLASILLKAGADPNHRNKYGCTALLNSCLSGTIDSIELLMEYGADPEIKDADGVKPSVFSLQAGPQVSAVLEKWKRKRSGAGPAPRENKCCDGCKETSKTTLHLCSRCRAARYCSRTCQRAHWPVHKPNCHPFNEESSLKLKPFYVPGVDIISTSSVVRSAMGYDQTKGKTSSSGGKAPSKHEYPKQVVIKVQIPFAGFDASPKQQAAAEQMGDCLVYTKKRDFVCQFRRIDNGNAWTSLVQVVKAKGVGGLKAYFAAEIRSKYEIVVKVSEVLAEQSF